MLGSRGARRLGQRGFRSRAVLEQLSASVPRRYSGDVGGVWHLLFSTTTDGTSLAHMLRTARSGEAFLLVVRTTDRRTFGAFCNELREPPHPAEHTRNSACLSIAPFPTGAPRPCRYPR